jgi:hypothetical protein
MKGRSPWILIGYLRYPSEVWPDEPSERGLSRPKAKRMKNSGRAIDILIDISWQEC